MQRITNKHIKNGGWKKRSPALFYNISLSLIYLLCCIDLNFSNFGGPYWISTTRIAVLIAVCLLINHILSRKVLGLRDHAISYARKGIPRIWITVFHFFIIILVVHVLQVYTDSGVVFSINSFFRIFNLLILFYTICVLLSSDRCDINFIVKTGTILTIFYGLAIICFVVWYSGIVSIFSPSVFRETFKEFSEENILFGGTNIALNRKMFGYLCMQVFPLSAFLSIEKKQKKYFKVLLILNFLLAFYISFFTGSRQFILGLLLCWLSLIYFIKKKKAHKIIFIFVSLAVIVLVFSEHFVGYYNSFVESRFALAYNSDIGRINLIKEAWTYFTKKPVIGHGPSSFIEFTGRYTHNGYMEMFVHWGLLGSIPFFYLIISIIHKGVKKRNKIVGSEKRVMTAFSIVNCVVTLFSSMFIAVFLEYSYWILLSFISGITNRKPKILIY